MNSTTGVPGWLIFAGSTAVALVFALGTVGLLLQGREVPQQLWMIDIGVGVAYFGAGPFSVSHSSISATNRALIETVNHGIATIRDAVGMVTSAGTNQASSIPTITPGEPASEA